MRQNIAIALLAGLLAGAPMLTAAETPSGATPANSKVDLPKVTHDRPAGNDDVKTNTTPIPLLGSL